MHLDVVVCFFLWTGIVPSLWEFVWNTSRNGICLYYYLEYLSLGRLYFTHNSGWHQELSTVRVKKGCHQGFNIGMHIQELQEVIYKFLWLNISYRYLIKFSSQDSCN